MNLKLDEVARIIGESVRAVLTEKITNGKMVIPTGTLDALVRETTNNTAGVLWLTIEERITDAFHLQLEVDTLSTLLSNRGAVGATLDQKVLHAIAIACANATSARGTCANCGCALPTHCNHCHTDY